MFANTIFIHTINHNFLIWNNIQDFLITFVYYSWILSFFCEFIKRFLFTRNWNSYFLFFFYEIFLFSDISGDFLRKINLGISVDWFEYKFTRNLIKFSIEYEIQINLNQSFLSKIKSQFLHFFITSNKNLLNFPSVSNLQNVYTKNNFTFVFPIFSVNSWIKISIIYVFEIHIFFLNINIKTESCINILLHFSINNYGFLRHLFNFIDFFIINYQWFLEFFCCQCEFHQIVNLILNTIPCWFKAFIFLVMISL